MPLSSDDYNADNPTTQDGMARLHTAGVQLTTAEQAITDQLRALKDQNPALDTGGLLTAFNDMRTAVAAHSDAMASMSGDSQDVPAGTTAVPTSSGSTVPAVDAVSGSDSGSSKSSGSSSKSKT